MPSHRNPWKMLSSDDGVFGFSAYSQFHPFDNRNVFRSGYPPELPAMLPEKLSMHSAAYMELRRPQRRYSTSAPALDPSQFEIICIMTHFLASLAQQYLRMGKL